MVLLEKLAIASLNYAKTPLVHKRKGISGTKEKASISSNNICWLNPAKNVCQKKSKKTLQFNSLWDIRQRKNR